MQLCCRAVDYGWWRECICVVELLITAGGENVSPVLIEDAVREQLPCVSNCMLIGDRRKFLSMLITLKVRPPCCVTSS